MEVVNTLNKKHIQQVKRILSFAQRSKKIFKPFKVKDKPDTDRLDGILFKDGRAISTDCKVLGIFPQPDLFATTDTKYLRLLEDIEIWYNWSVERQQFENEKGFVRFPCHYEHITNTPLLDFSMDADVLNELCRIVSIATKGSVSRAVFCHIHNQTIQWFMPITSNFTAIYDDLKCSRLAKQFVRTKMDNVDVNLWDASDTILRAHGDHNTTFCFGLDVDYLTKILKPYKKGVWVSLGVKNYKSAIRVTVSDEIFWVMPIINSTFSATY